MLHITKRAGSPYWQVVGSFGGKRFRKSTGTTEKRVAEALCKKWQNELDDKVLLGEDASRTLAEAFEVYLDQGGEGKFLGPILEYGGHDAIRSINKKWFTDIAKDIWPDGASVGTINRQLYTPVLATLNCAAEIGWCGKPAIRRPKGHTRQQKRVPWLTPETVEAGINAADPHDAWLLTLFVGLGQREEDMLRRLTWDDTWPEHKMARMDISKGERELHELFLQPRVVQALETVKDQTGLVLKRPNGTPYAPPDKRYQFTKTWRRIALAAGFPKFGTHVLRHTFATWHYAVHRDLLRLRDEGGWASVGIVERYAVNATPDLKERVLAHGWTMEK